MTWTLNSTVCYYTALLFFGEVLSVHYNATFKHCGIFSVFIFFLTAYLIQGCHLLSVHIWHPLLQRRDSHGEVSRMTITWLSMMSLIMWFCSPDQCVSAERYWNRTSPKLGTAYILESRPLSRYAHSTSFRSVARKGFFLLMGCT